MESYPNSNDFGFKFSPECLPFDNVDTLQQILFDNKDCSNATRYNDNFESCEKPITIDMSNDSEFGDLSRFLNGDTNVNEDFEQLLDDPKKEQDTFYENDINFNNFRNDFNDPRSNSNSVYTPHTPFSETSFDTNSFSSRIESPMNNFPEIKREYTEEDSTKAGPLRPRRNSSKRKNQYSDYIYDSPTATPKSSCKKSRISVLNTPNTRAYNPVPQEERDENWLEKRKRNNEAVVKSRNKKKEKLEAEHRELEQLRVDSVKDKEEISNLKSEISQKNDTISKMKIRMSTLVDENNYLKNELSRRQIMYSKPIHNRISVPRVVSTAREGKWELYPPNEDCSMRRG
uniref:BZIP domain-containing protein n=1 Tax=Parastrongyloides trichosuri TaxID=131310 RepID=A0A0N4ZQR1_PARTI